MSDRPEPRRRSTPRPADDEHVDPIDPPGRPAPAAAPQRRRRQPQAFAQLNTRVEMVLNDLISVVSDETGWSKREVVENALKKTYPEQYQALLRESQQAS